MRVVSGRFGGRTLAVVSALVIPLGLATTARADQAPPGGGGGYPPATIKASGPGVSGSVTFDWAGKKDLSYLKYKIKDTNCDDDGSDLYVMVRIEFDTTGGTGHTGWHYNESGCYTTTTQNLTSFHVSEGSVVDAYMEACVGDDDPGDPDVVNHGSAVSAETIDNGECYQGAIAYNPFEP